MPPWQNDEIPWRKTCLCNHLSWRADRAVVRATVAKDYTALQYAAPELRADRAVVLAAVAQSG